MVFLKRMVVGGRPYYAIAESYRDEDGRTQTRYWRRLGVLSDLEASWWKTILSSPTHDVPRQFISLDKFVCYRSLSHGVPSLANGMIVMSGLKAILFESLSPVHEKSRLVRLMEAMMINRLDDPCSKLALLDWIKRTSLPYTLNLIGLNKDMFYHAMDVLWERRDLIERKVYEMIVKPLSSGQILAKDITSTYFEGYKSPIAEYGYSRDHRPDLKQVTFSLIETEEGYPITLEVYPGDTQDKETVEESVKRLKTIFGITRGIFVYDRGMATDENMEFVRNNGFNYIASELISTDDVRDAIEQALKEGLELWDESSALKGREVIRDGIRYIVIHSSSKEKRDKERIEKILAKAENVLSKAQKHVAKHVRMTREQVIEYVARTVQKNKLSPYFVKGSVSFDESSRKITVRYDDEKVERERRRYAGIWVLSTDIPKERKDAMEIVRMYRGLWVIEKTFRTMKSSLDLRPMWHRKPDRIKAHIWICMIAYLIARMMEEKVRRERIEGFENSTADQIIEKFRNVMMNEQGFRDERSGMDRRWWAATELDEEQLAILRALEIDAKAFKVRRAYSTPESRQTKLI